MLTDIQKAQINRTSRFVQKKLINIESGHDWWHSWRVSQIASFLAVKEEANELICTIAALLHDVSDPKFTATSGELYKFSAKMHISRLKLEKSVKEAILYIIENLSYGTELSGKVDKSIEFKVVQDADRLDAIGAIGIARAFNYGGYKNRRMNIPDSVPLIYESTEEYRQSNSTTIMHFYEKLLLLKDLMNTKSAKFIAEDRHQYMCDFLKRFSFEWNEFSEKVKNKNPGNPGF